MRPQTPTNLVMALLDIINIHRTNPTRQQWAGCVLYPYGKHTTYVV